MGHDPNEIIAAFASFDNGNSGKVDAEELRKALTTMGDKLSDREFEELHKYAGGMSNIDYKKFVDSFTAKAVPMTFEDDDE